MDDIPYSVTIIIIFNVLKNYTFCKNKKRIQLVFLNNDFDKKHGVFRIKIFLLSKAKGALSPEVKRLGREANHLVLTLRISGTIYLIPIRLSGVNKDNLTFTVYFTFLHTIQNHNFICCFVRV